MTFPFFSILLAAIAQFMVGAIWYSVFFDRLWMRIHNMDRFSPEEMQAMKKKMGPFYALQLVVTLLTTGVLFVALQARPDWSAFSITLALWLGFVLPTQVSGVIFGGTEAKWIAKKILVSASGALACLLAGAAVLQWVL